MNEAAHCERGAHVNAAANLVASAVGAADGSQGRAKRSPWICLKKRGSSERATETDVLCRTFGARIIAGCDPGAARSLRSRLPLATSYSAFGAEREQSRSAPPALSTSGRVVAPTRYQQINAPADKNS